MIDAMNKRLTVVFAVVLAVVLLGVAGRCDYVEEVIYDMPAGVYQVMNRELGNPGDYKIAREYSRNPEYWQNRAMEEEIGSSIQIKREL